MFPKTQLPYILSDVANDLTANGVLDTEKFTREGQKWIEAGLAEDNEIIPIGKAIRLMVTLGCKSDCIGEHPFLEGNTEATCESRESVETTRQTPWVN